MINVRSLFVVPVLVALFAVAGCGSSSSSSDSSTAASGNVPQGGTLHVGAVDNPDHLDPAFAYTAEGWEILEATNNGLLGFKKVAGDAGTEVEADLAKALPTVSSDGKTYTFTLRDGVKFGPPASRAIKASDVKATIERLFSADSPGVGFYTGIVGAEEFQKNPTSGGISGIVADDAKGTVTFKLTKKDGTFNEYMSIPFSFILPKGTPNKDISTEKKYRVATGPYAISTYVPKESIKLTRNPDFKAWAPGQAKGNLDAIDIKIGVTPEQAVNEIANGQLDWYLQTVAPDRLTEIKARYPDQVKDYVRANITFFTLNTRKAPLTDVNVRKAINYAVDRDALVKIFGGQGAASENILPPTMGTAYAAHSFYPYDLPKAKQLVDASGTKGQSVEVWASNTDPQPKAAQYMAGVLDSLGYKATVKTLDEGIYYDTVGNEKTDPQISYNDWNQDFAEGSNFIDPLLNGDRITNEGNNNGANIDVPALNSKINAALEMPLGPARNKQWAEVDATMMKDYAPWVPFLNRRYPKFYGKNVKGVEFHGTFFELFPSVYLQK